ncbi:MAG: hypothetical protein QM564_01230 [Bergeyella sp.]
MKNIFFGSLIVFFAFLSCGSEEPDGQYIDQIVHLYIDSAGQDMLNSNISGSYTAVTMNDEYGTTDSAPVSVSIKSDADTVRYIEYVAGAKRILVDSSDVNNKIYQSKISLTLTRKVNDTLNSTFSDILILNYRYTPDVFQLQEAYYNNQLVFTKTAGQPNIVKVIK